jgi:hypothetical protein
MGDYEEIGDIATSSYVCIAAFKTLLQHGFAELTDMRIYMERDPRTFTGLPKNQRLSETNENLDCFGSRTQSLSTQSSNSTVFFHEIETAFARFKIWAGNLGALQRGSSSLDVRLRESSVMRIAILQILNSFRETLNECKLLPRLLNHGRSLLCAYHYTRLRIK